MTEVVYPLFSSPVYGKVISENLKDIFSSLKKEPFESANNQGTSISTTKNILDKYPRLEKVLLKEFNYFKNTYLHYESTDFYMTTSWMTKCTPNSCGYMHNHKNCVYSGVLYFQDEIGSIQFSNENIIPESIMLNEPSEYNLYNSSSWEITPKKNLMIIFPSYLFHKVNTHISNENRYSLAFNLFPKGNIGKNDSSLRVFK